MKLKIEIVMDNAAFEPSSGAEVARILREFSEGVEHSSFKDNIGADMPLRDINGNTVGRAKVAR